MEVRPNTVNKNIKTYSGLSWRVQFYKPADIRRILDIKIIRQCLYAVTGRLEKYLFFGIPSLRAP